MIKTIIIMGNICLSLYQLIETQKRIKIPPKSGLLSNMTNENRVIRPIQLTVE
jgi:hypothetical protein